MTSSWQSSTWLLLGAPLILFLYLGIRHGFGLFLEPMRQEFGWGRGVFAFAMALQNLVWGIAQPFAGAVADRFGAQRTILARVLLYAGGLVLMGLSASPLALSLSAGVMIGIGLSGTSFAVLLGVVGRAAPPDRRSLAMGIAAAAGSFGQFAMLPGSLQLLNWLGWSSALIALGLLAMLMMPMITMVRDRPAMAASIGPDQTMRQALMLASRHTGFWLLALGFFVCGFQVVFIGIHLPAYLVGRNLPVLVGTTVLALVGLFNVFGTYIAGWLGERHAKPRLLSLLYLARGVVIVLFVSTPLSTGSAYAFGIAMGLLWLSTVPLTNGTIATPHGVRNLAMLSGIVFLFHQLGAFLGGWLGGLIYDRTGSYDSVWMMSIVLSVVAAALNWPIREQSAISLQGAPA